MKTKFNLFPLILISGLLIFTACKKDDDEPLPMEEEKNIVEVAQEAGQFSVLIQAAQKAGLANFLSTESDITVFAPTDDAFAALLSDLGASSLDDIDATTLASILKYHVVADGVMSSDLSTGAVPSLNDESPDGEALSIWVTTGSSVMINDATVTTADVEASNGFIHVIDKVLLPPTVVDIATFVDDFSSLVAAVVKADLATTLSSEGPYTVFAPTNASFDDLFSQLGISGLDDLTAEQLVPILTYHVVGDNVLSSELSDGMVLTLSGESLDIMLGSDVTINGTVKVTLADVQATNGVIHVIDAVLVYEEESNTIADIAGADTNFSMLVDALTKASLVDAVSDSEANLTVFAPTNDAFTALLSDLGLSSIDDIPVDELTNILLYHVIGSKAMSTDLSTGYLSTLALYSENNISVYVEVDGEVFINGSTTVTTADIEADNGVIHVVDKVILPPTVVDVAIANDNFTTLVEAVVKAELVETLNGDGPFTVFAPTNDAFDALFTDLGVSGIDDLSKEQLVPILTYHVVSGNVLSTSLTNGDVATLNDGNSITVDLSSGVMINNAQVVAADIQSANGVVHVINKVLIPE